MKEGGAPTSILKPPRTTLQCTCCGNIALETVPQLLVVML
jgi:hypothetical protein